MIQSTGRKPTIVLSGHVHSYQRFERDIGGKIAVPYVVEGAGGYANTPKLIHKIELDKSGQRLPPGFQTARPDLKIMSYNDQEPGYLRITVDNKKKTLTGDYFLVPFNSDPFEKMPFDTVTVPW